MVLPSITESESMIASRAALIAVSPSASVLCSRVIDLVNILSQPVFRTVFCCRSSRVNAPPPVGSSSKKVPWI